METRVRDRLVVDWIISRKSQNNALRSELLTHDRFKNNVGVILGYKPSTVKKYKQIARRKARKDIETLIRIGIVDKDDDIAKEALQNTLEVMRSPGNQVLRLQAARQVLEWTKSKPVAKSEVTVNAAEAWLKEISED